MCIFCDIVNKKIKADIVYEDSDVLAFRDIHPEAPVHVLIIPKKHIESISDLEDSEENVLLMGKIIMAAKKIADKEGIGSIGYKLLFRVGRGGGQEMPHIHLHLTGGKIEVHKVKSL